MKGVITQANHNPLLAEQDMTLGVKVGIEQFGQPCDVVAVVCPAGTGDQVREKIKRVMRDGPKKR